MMVTHSFKIKKLCLIFKTVFVFYNIKKTTVVNNYNYYIFGGNSGYHGKAFVKDGMSYFM